MDGFPAAAAVTGSLSTPTTRLDREQGGGGGGRGGRGGSTPGDRHGTHTVCLFPYTLSPCYALFVTVVVSLRDRGSVTTDGLLRELV